MKRDIRLAVFDLDGTLADTAPDMVVAMSKVTAKYGEFRDLGALLRSYLGEGVYVLFDKLYAHLGLPAEHADDIAAYKREYAANCTACSRPYPGTLPMLRGLKERGVQVAVATMKPKMATGKVLHDLGIEPYVDLWLAQDDMLRPKPDPWCVEECARRCGVSPQETLVAGDSLVDVQAAQAAGALSVAVMGGYFNQEAMRKSGADVTITDIKEVLSLI